MNKDVKELAVNLAWAGAMLAVALGAAFARNRGWIEGDTVLRLVLAMNGLWMIWYGNRMPKTLVPIPGDGARQARRVASWSLVLSGLVYAGLWAFAPFQVALWGGVIAVVAGVGVTFGYCLSLRDGVRV